MFWTKEQSCDILEFLNNIVRLALTSNPIIFAMLRKKCVKI